MFASVAIVSYLAVCAQLVAASDLLSGATQLHRWANGEQGFSCSIRCNGRNVAHLDELPDSWPLYSCWGEFRAECTGDAHETHTVSSITKCEGAFATVRHAAGDDDDAEALGKTRVGASALDAVRESLHTELQHHSHKMLEGKNVTFFGCEGRYFSLTKVVPKSRDEREERAERLGDDSSENAMDLTSMHLLAADVDGDGDAHGHKHHHKKCKRRHKTHFADSDDDMKGHIMGAVCTGKMHNVIISPAKMNITLLATCSDAFMTGKGTKSFPSHTSTAKITKKFAKAEKHLTKKLAKHAPVSGAHMSSAGQVSGLSAGAVPDELLADNAGTSALTCAATGDAPSSPPHCRATCNHHPLAWHGWWPCKGELELGCEDSKEVHGNSVCSLLDAKCIGLSWPRFMACSGLYTELKEAAGEAQDGKQFAIETLSITNGFRKAKGASKDGWNGVLIFGKGPSSLRIHGGVADDEADDTSAEAAIMGVEDADVVLRADVA